MDVNATTMIQETKAPSSEIWTCDAEQSISSHQLLERIASGSAGFQAQMYIPIALLVVMFAMFVDEVVFLTKDITDWRRLSYLIWTVSSFPFLGLLCVMGIFMPRTINITSFATSFYFAIVIKKFFMLVLNYYGGRRKMVTALRADKVVSSNPFPCCFVCCCCNQPMTVSRINILQGLVYQVIIVYPLAYFITTLFVAEGLRSRAALFSLSAIDLLASLSSFVCLYGFVVFNKASRYALQQFHIRGKFICVQMVVAFNTVQGFTIRIVNRFGGLPCGFPYPDKENAEIFHSYIFFYELFVLAVIAWFVYKKSEDGAEVLIREEPSSYYNKASDAIDVVNIPIEDNAWNNNNSKPHQVNEKQDYQLPELDQKII